MRLLGRIVLLVVVAAGAAVGYAVMTGLDARATPGSIERIVMGRLRRLAIPGEVRERVNPAPSDVETIDGAMEHFADHCASCHGNDGSGDTAIGRGLYPKPPDMRQPATQGQTDGELFWVIEHGVRFTGMPAFATGTADGERASWALVRFIRRLPALTAEQIDRMQAMNPVPPAETRHRIEEEQFLEGAH